MTTSPKADPASNTYDLSMFDHKDLLNIVLQRSRVLYDVPNSGRIIRKWSDGQVDLLEQAVAEKGSILAVRALQIIEQEFQPLHPMLDELKPTRFADIGCGYGFLDLFIAKTYGAHAHLIDLEENEVRDFGFNQEGAAYSNLAKAAQFLTKNGISPQNVSTYNPAKDDLSGIKDLDMIISTLACGFHFPVDVYMPFFQSSLREGGALILDLRLKSSRRQRNVLETLGDIYTLEEAPKYHRVVVIKRSDGLDQIQGG